MASSTTALVLEHYDALSDVSSSGKAQALTRIANLLNGAVSGAGHQRAVAVELFQNSSAPCKAFGTYVLATASGDLDTVINGVTITTAYDTSDIITATAIAAAINASTDALVQYIVEASNWRANVALATSVDGNWLELTLSDGRKWRFVSGTDFTNTGTDSQDATSLASAINATPILNHHVYAYTSTGNVRVHQRRGAAATFTAAKFGAPLTLTANAATATVGVSALQPGVMGNCITTTASGTNITAGAARLVGGTGVNASATRFDL